MADNEEQSSTRPPRLVVRPFRGPVGATPSTPHSPVAPPIRPAMPPFASRMVPSAKTVPASAPRVASLTPVVPVAASTPQDSESAALALDSSIAEGSIATSLATDWHSLLRGSPDADRVEGPSAAAVEVAAAETAPGTSGSPATTRSAEAQGAYERPRDEMAEQGTDAQLAASTEEDFEVDAYAYPAVVAEASSDVIDAVVRRDFASPPIGASVVDFGYPHVDGAAAADDVDAYRLAAVESSGDDQDEELESAVPLAVVREPSAHRSTNADLRAAVISGDGELDARNLADDPTIAGAIAAGEASDSGDRARASAAEQHRDAPPASSTPDDEAARSIAETPPSGSAVLSSAPDRGIGALRVPEQHVLPRFDASVAAVADHDVEQSVSDDQLMSYVTPPIAEGMTERSTAGAPSAVTREAAIEEAETSALLNADVERLIDEVDDARAMDTRDDSVTPVDGTRASEFFAITAPSETVHDAVGDGEGDRVSEAENEERRVAPAGALDSTGIADAPPTVTLDAEEVPDAPPPAIAVVARVGVTQPDVDAAERSLAGALERIAARIRAGDLADRRMPTGASDASVLAAALSTLLAGDA